MDSTTNGTKQNNMNLKYLRRYFPWHSCFYFTFQRKLVFLYYTHFYIGSHSAFLCQQTFSNEFLSFRLNHIPFWSRIVVQTANNLIRIRTRNMLHAGGRLLQQWLTVSGERTRVTRNSIYTTTMRVRFGNSEDVWRFEINGPETEAAFQCIYTPRR